MTPLRLLAIICIFFCTMIGWFILGASIDVRTSEKSLDLGRRLESNWGGPHEQMAPQFYYYEDAPSIIAETSTNAQGQTVTVQKSVVRPQRRYLESQKTDIKTKFGVDFRPKGLLWYSVYKVDFEGRYQIVNLTSKALDIYVQFRFPSQNSIYDDFRFMADSSALSDQEDLVNRENGGNTTSSARGGEMTGKLLVRPGDSTEFTVGYRSQGTNMWQYHFGEGTQRVKNFTLTAETQFKDFNIPESCIAPGEKKETDSGWILTWRYKDNISNIRIGIDMPKKLNPGPIAERISFFAPVSLLFFFTILIIVSGVRKIAIHPMNYFFLAAAFFAFHLLFAYLVDHLPLELSFFTSAVVSVLLVFTYMRLVTDNKFTLQMILPTQIVYLVLFSFSFFFEGYTGLTITLGAIATLFVLMQMTAKVQWGEIFGPTKQG